MESQTLSAKERQHLEEILDQFDRALKDCRSGSLPSVDEFLTSYEGNQLDYLRKEMSLVWREVVRGDYVKLRRLGGGGMGEVFLARHVALGRDFALKEIKLECLRHSDRAEFEKRFRREIEACGRLEHHPNLVNVTNTGTSDDGVPYLVMDYIEGLDLKQVVERCGPLPSPVAARIIHDAAAGLAHAHEKGLVHRDIKPSNIMISKHGVVVVLDLGLARVIESDRQASVVSMPGLVGSFDYMSPEQCREEEHVDLRADIYALGCTLYFLLAGSAPFAEAKSIFQKLNAHQQDALPELKRDDVDPLLRQALERMTAKDRDERFANLEEVVALLKPLSRDAQLDVLVRHSGQQIRETSESDSHSTVAYQTRRIVHTAPAGSPTARGGAAGASLARGGDASAGSSRFGSATRVIRRQLTRRRFLVIGGLTAVGAATAGGIVWSRRRTAAADFLGTLPGMNGHWWFKEVPWLLPDVRWHLAESLGFWSTGFDALRAAAESADVPAFYTLLKERISTVYRGWPDETATRFGLLQKFDPEKLPEEAVNEVVTQMLAQLGGKPQVELSATDWHLLGVLHHHGDKFEAAADAYQSALEAYQNEGSYGLAALCLGDWGQMRMQQSKPVLAQEKFSRARELIFQHSQTPRDALRLFELDALCAEADSHRKYSNWDAAQQSLQLALPLAEALPEDHPLRAVFHERCGWYHFDVWREDRAKREFRQALAIREQNDRDGNDLALHFVWWNRQGQAMVDFYLDEPAASAAALESLLPAGIAANPQHYTDRQMRELLARQPNLLERLSDAEWLDPAKRDQAVEHLANAIRTAENDNFRDKGRGAILARLKFKLAVFAALAGKPSEAKEHFQAGEQEADAYRKANSATSGSKSGRPPLYDATHKIAAACLDALSGEAAAGDAVKSDGLTRLVDQYQRDPGAVTRDELQLLLLVGEWFLNRDDGSTDADAKRKLAGGMIRQCAVRPRGKPVGDAATDDWRLPKLLERYRAAAAKYVG